MDQQPHTISHVMFLIFSGTAVLSTIALFTRQSLLVVYIILGAILGPWGLKLISHGNIVKQSGEIGIIFLLFLLGLHLQPQNLFHSLRKMSLITLSSSFIFFITGFVTCYAFGLTYKESLIIGIAGMFSSTIIGLKLLPTTILHHQHTGELVISILLLQDIIAIGSILALQIIGIRSESRDLILIIIAFPILLTVAYLFQRYILAWLLAKFDKIHEYIFILSIGWCLFMAEFSHAFGLSEEIGAFIAGVALASHPIAFYIAESLKPLRDFFLVLFFFSIGASFNFDYFRQVFAPACILAAFSLMLKPMIFNWLLQWSGEVKSVSWEIGVRLGQMSEFSLLVIYMALENHMMSPLTAHMAEAAIIFTFIISCYWTVMQYPTPLAVTDKLRRD
ncbi:MAG: cation:proton antiporter [Gammaproteobacteria bacterium]|nr:cation:proton antiporter [Gammaproteobacteria bacterium]MCW5582285.1 cation:proton antiporter [Gammaproteobacteria bacterium]